MLLTDVIEDAAGNGMDPCSFRSSAGGAVSGGNAAPIVTAITTNPDDPVTAIDLDTDAVLWEAPVGARPMGIARADDGSLWVACRDADAIVVLDPAAGAIDATLRLAHGAAPVAIAPIPDGTEMLVSLDGDGAVFPRRQRGNACRCVQIATTPAPIATATPTDAIAPTPTPTATAVPSCNPAFPGLGCGSPLVVERLRLSLGAVRRQDSGQIKLRGRMDEAIDPPQLALEWAAGLQVRFHDADDSFAVTVALPACEPRSRGRSVVCGRMRSGARAFLRQRRDTWRITLAARDLSGVDTGADDPLANPSEAPATVALARGGFVHLGATVQGNESDPRRVACRD